MSLFRAHYYNRNNFESLPLNICRDIFLMIPEVIYTRKHFYLLDEINQKISHLKSSGLIELWHLQSLEKIITRKIKLTGPKVLTFKDLKGCFQIVLFSSFLGLIAFVIEILMKYK